MWYFEMIMHLSDLCSHGALQGEISIFGNIFIYFDSKYMANCQLGHWPCIKNVGMQEINNTEIKQLGRFLLKSCTAGYSLRQWGKKVKHRGCTACGEGLYRHQPLQCSFCLRFMQCRQQRRKSICDNFCSLILDIHCIYNNIFSFKKVIVFQWKNWFKNPVITVQSRNNKVIRVTFCKQITMATINSSPCYEKNSYFIYKIYIAASSHMAIQGGLHRYKNTL